MERRETTVVETAPEKKQSVVRKQQEFGWTLVSAQDDTKLTGGQSRKQVKLLFTRTASDDWIKDMNLLQKELEDHDKSVKFGTDKLVLIGDKPSSSLPVPILIVIAFAGYLAGWIVLDMVGGIIMGPVAAAGSWLFFRQRAKRLIEQHTTRRKKATEAFLNKRREILARVRLHAASRH